MAYNFNFFQIPQVGIEGGMSDTMGGAQNRPYAMKMSNFGAMNYGNRRSDDYTRIDFAFKDKGELENPSIPSFSQEAEYDLNPYVTGSTVKRLRDHKGIVMGMGFHDGSVAGFVGKPSFDISDTFAAVDDGTNSPKTFPDEGWRTFGGRTGGPFSYSTSL